jgi:hypothetical protein
MVMALAGIILGAFVTWWVTYFYSFPRRLPNNSMIGATRSGHDDQDCMTLKMRL